MKPSPISTLFRPGFLDSELKNYSIELIPGIDEKRLVIQNWINELNSGRLELSKEEEIKPRFLQDIFGGVLGYGAHGPEIWNARPEQKTFVDATVADAGLGLFLLSDGEIQNDVIAVVEIKGAKADLDSTKNSNNQTAVEQGFGYSAKTGATWVIVSNFKEVRIYRSDYAGRCETFWLKDLDQEESFKRFLMLMHRKNLMEGIKSRLQKLYDLHENQEAVATMEQFDSSDHILDQIWKTLKKFDGIRSIDPYIIANIPPFNILKESVWHYQYRTLLTLNPKIYNLLQGVSVDKDGSVQVSDELGNELKGAKVTDYHAKIDFVLKCLRSALIEHVTAIRNVDEIISRNKYVIGFSIRHEFSFDSKDGITKDIYFDDQDSCQCHSCQFSQLDLKAFLRKLKENSSPSLELAYGHYLAATDGYSRAFKIYSQIILNNEGKYDKNAETFVAYYNQKHLLNRISAYDDPEKEKHMNTIREIDLDEILNQSFTSMGKITREALKEIRDERVAERVINELDDLLKKLIEIKARYDRGGGYDIVPNYTSGIHQFFCHAYAFLKRNYLIQNRYAYIVRQMLQGILITHRLSKYAYHLEELYLIHIIEPTLFLSHNQTDELLNECDKINVTEKDLREYIRRLKNFLDSHIDVGIMGHISLEISMQEQLVVFDFRQKCERIFTNFFLFLTKIEIPEIIWDKNINTSIVRFLQVQDYLHWFNLDKLGKFIEAKAGLFTDEEIKEIHAIANRKNMNGLTTWPPLINGCINALKTSYPETKISELPTVYKALSDATDKQGGVRYFDLISLYTVCTPPLQAKIKEELDSYLRLNFNTDCYEKCLHAGIYSIDHEDFFSLYVQKIQASKWQGLVSIENGKPNFSDFTFYNFAIVVRKFKIAGGDIRLNVLTNLQLSEKWLLNPETFDYAQFDPFWVKAYDHPILLESMQGIPNIKSALHARLAITYDRGLSEIYFRYFA